MALDDGTTRVDIVHTGWEHLAAEGPSWRDANAGGWYGLRKGYRAQFANYVPPVLEHFGLAEVEHGARNNRMRASPCRLR